MDKRILALGSILAVAILIGVSFNSVVGYSSSKSTSVRASPLYSIRSNRAIENGEDVTTCDFVGKGKEITIPFPENNYILEVIKKLRQMDKKEIKELNNYLRKHKIVNNLVKNHQKEIGQLGLENTYDTEDVRCPTLGGDEAFINCFFHYLIRVLVAFMAIPFVIVAVLGFITLIILKELIGQPTGWYSFCNTACSDTYCHTQCMDSLFCQCNN